MKRWGVIDKGEHIDCLGHNWEIHRSGTYFRTCKRCNRLEELREIYEEECDHIPSHNNLGSNYCMKCLKALDKPFPKLPQQLDEYAGYQTNFNNIARDKINEIIRFLEDYLKAKEEGR